MKALKFTCSYIINIIFLFGWLCFYVFLSISFMESIIPGSLAHGGKPSDLNFYIFLLWYIALSMSYSFLFFRYFKDFFIKKVNMIAKSIIILKSISLILLLYATLLSAMILSTVFGISHIETAFWYKG